MGSSTPVAPAPPGGRSKSTSRTLVILFLLSLVIRLAAWAPVAYSGVPPTYDEISYVERAAAYENLAKSYLRGGIFWAEPSEADLRAAYRSGVWPPLHSMLIGLAFAVFGRGLAVARLVVVLQSAATTCVVFALTSRLATRRAALVAAVIHAVYPSFVAYSHLLWSETTYILACLGALYFTLRIVAESRLRRRLLFAVSSGVLLGLAGLTRAAALPLMLAVPGWLLWRVRSSRRGLLLPVVLLAANVLVLLPWQATLWAREQRFVLLSTKAGYYLYEGNHPWVGEDRATRKMRAATDEYMRQHGVSPDEAGRSLAAAYIREHPGGFVHRCLQRAAALCGPDWSVVRHVLYAAYPPLPLPVASTLTMLVVLSFPVLMTGVLCGLCSRRTEFQHRSLLVVCVLLGMAPSVICVANSRMTLPLLALLLPAAGVGLATLAARRSWGRGVLLLAVTAAGVWALNPRLPRAALGKRNQASAYYAPLTRGIERVFSPAGVGAQDCIYLRCGYSRRPGSVHLEIVNSPYVFGGSKSGSFVWKNAQPGEIRRLYIRAPRTPDQPPIIRMTDARTGKSARLRPLRRDAWRHWRPTGVERVDCFWAGTAGLADLEVERLFQRRAEAVRESAMPASTDDADEWLE